MLLSFPLPSIVPVDQNESCGNDRGVVAPLLFVVLPFGCSGAERIKVMLICNILLSIFTLDIYLIETSREPLISFQTGPYKLYT